MGSTIARPARRYHLLEDATGELSPNRNSVVDRTRGIVRGVKIIGNKSSNDGGRFYPPDVLRQAIPLYEGACVNVDHPNRPEDQRPVSSRLGKLINVRTGPGGLYGDLVLIKNHPLAESVMEAAEDPLKHSCYGFSHHAEGEVEHQDGRLVVTAITEVRSVDLVSDPATTTGLFESKSLRQRPRDRNQKKRTYPMAYTLKEWFDRTRLLRPARKKITRLFEMGFMEPDQEMAMKEAEGDDLPLPGDDSEPVTAGPQGEGADPADLDPEEALRQGFRAACVAVLDDGTLDVKAKVSRLKELLTAADNLIGSGQEIPEAEEPDKDKSKKPEGLPEAEMEEPDEEDAPLMEGDDEGCDMPSKKLVKESRELSLLRAEKHSRQLCEDAGVMPSSTLLEALARLPDDGRRKALIEEHRQGQPRRASGRTAAELTEQGRKGAKNGSGPLGDPTDAKEFSERLFNRG